MLSIPFETVKSWSEEKEKNMISREFFAFSNSSNFWKFRNRFEINVNKCFWQIMNTLELRYFFAKVLTHYKTDLKYAVTMPLHQEYFLTCIYSCIKFDIQNLKMRGTWDIGACKSPTSFFMSNAFFNLASVLLNYFMNSISYVA